MQKTIMHSISSEIYRRYPEFRGVEPSVKLHASADASDNQVLTTYLLIYRSTYQVAGNKSLARVLRVVANEDGKILKVSTSRG